MYLLLFMSRSFSRNVDGQVSTHFGTKLYEACKHLDTDGEGSITTGQLRKLFFGDYTAAEGSDNKVGVVSAPLLLPPCCFPLLSPVASLLRVASKISSCIKSRSVRFVVACWRRLILVLSLPEMTTEASACVVDTKKTCLVESRACACRFSPPKTKHEKVATMSCETNLHQFRTHVVPTLNLTLSQLNTRTR